MRKRSNFPNTFVFGCRYHTAFFCFFGLGFIVLLIVIFFFSQPIREDLVIAAYLHNPQHTVHQLCKQLISKDFKLF